jgi:CRISPR system Cascade subunit CasB
MSTFISSLVSLDARSTKVRAVLRRSLGFEPGTYPAAFPYVEQFVAGGTDSWRRHVHYLVAGLWALGGMSGEESFARILANYDREHKHHANPSEVSSIERRFIALLDSDSEQLAYRLRQLITLVRDTPMDWDSLLKDLLYWKSRNKTTQVKWAREYYREAEEEASDSIQE